MMGNISWLKEDDSLKTFRSSYQFIGKHVVMIKVRHVPQEYEKRESCIYPLTWRTIVVGWPKVFVAVRRTLRLVK